MGMSVLHVTQSVDVPPVHVEHVLLHGWQSSDESA
jgi:hypothetical protein